MGMPPNHFAANAGAHIAEIKPILFLFHAGVKNDLEKYVAKLFPQQGGIFAVDGLNSLVSFLQKVVPDGMMILFLIPGTSLRASEDLYNPNKIVNSI